MAMFGHLDFLSGQAAKKILEANGLDRDDAIHEYMGAINYLASRILYLRGLPLDEKAKEIQEEEKK